MIGENVTLETIDKNYWSDYVLKIIMYVKFSLIPEFIFISKGWHIHSVIRRFKNTNHILENRNPKLGIAVINTILRYNTRSTESLISA